MFPQQGLPWGNRLKLLAPCSGRTNIVSKVFLPAFWVLLFITPISLLFFSFHFLWAEPTAWKKKSALERKTANYIQMLETGMVIISSRGVQVLCSVTGEKDLRRNRKTGFARKSPKLLDSHRQLRREVIFQRWRRQHGVRDLRTKDVNYSFRRRQS